MSVVIGPATCSKCRHAARGSAIDMRPRVVTFRPRGQPPAVNPSRPSLVGGDYICGRNGLTPAKPDPVTGFVGMPSGPDCRDLNPDGACEHYQRGYSVSDVSAGLIIIWSATVVLALVSAIWGLL